MHRLLLMGTFGLALIATAAAQEAPAGAPAPSAATQEVPPAAPAPPTVARPATVNGASITASDVALQRQLLPSSARRLDEAAQQHVARRAVAEEVLLSQEATRLGVELNDRDVDAWWEQRTGKPPDYALFAAASGTSEERQREMARRAALADTYLLHRCGLRAEQGARLPPDPLLVRVVTITPSQLREAFTQNRELFDRPEALDCEVWILQDESALKAAEEALATGGRPEAPPLLRTLPLPEVRRLFPAEAAEWLGQAADGDHRILDAHTLLRVVARHPPEPATFAEVQEPLRNLLLNELLTEARQHLVSGLRAHATYWPPDLFEAPQPPRDTPPELTPADPPAAAPASP